MRALAIITVGLIFLAGCAPKPEARRVLSKAPVAPPPVPGADTVESSLASGEAVILPPRVITNTFWLSCDPRPDITRVKAYAGAASRSYTIAAWGGGNSAQLTLVRTVDSIWFLALTAISPSGAESAYSEEITIPYRPRYVVLSGWGTNAVTLERSFSSTGPFTSFTNATTPTVRVDLLRNTNECFRARGPLPIRLTIAIR